MRPIVILALVCMAATAGADVGDDAARAARFFDEGRQAYERGDYAGARAGFEAARQLRPLPELDYDIARCWDQLGHANEAVVEYRRFLTAAPDGPQAGAVRARIAALDRPAAPPPSEAPRRRLTAPIAVGAVAVAAAITGAALVGSVAPDYNDLKRTCQGACVHAQWSGLEARANAGYAMFGVAGALAIADGILWYVALRRGHQERAQASSFDRRLGLGASLASSATPATVELRF